MDLLWYMSQAQVLDAVHGFGMKPEFNYEEHARERYEELTDRADLDEAGKLRGRLQKVIGAVAKSRRSNETDNMMWG